MSIIELSIIIFFRNHEKEMEYEKGNILHIGIISDTHKCSRKLRGIL